jgi:SpoVK/Ycf46/Vps4 family AAA+-type ATPase
MGFMDDISRFIDLIKCGNTCISIVTYEEYEALEVVRQAAEKLEYGMQVWSVGRGVRNGFFPVLPTPAEMEPKTPEHGLKMFLQAPPKTICVALDLAPFLSEQVTLRTLRDTINLLKANLNILVLVHGEDILPGVIKTYTREFELSLPGEKELDNLIRTTLREIHDKTPLQIGITKNGLTAIIRNLRGLSLRQAKQIIYDSVSIDKKFSDMDVNKVIAGKRRMIRTDGLLEYVEAPLDMSEIGGMNTLKHWLTHRQNAFTEQAIEYGITPPRGVMILGVQGAGKSLCAKAIATAWHQPLYRLDPGILFNSYVGQSENNLRHALKQIEAMAPAVLWIDEIEKGFASAASQSTDGGLSKRMFGTLLTWMQEHRQPVFLVATANDIEALPPELLRKGRFDEIFFVNLPGPAARKEMFQIHLTKHKRDPQKYDLDCLAKESHGYSGAEIEQAVISALHEGFSRQMDLTTEMIVAAMKSSPPLSITMREKMEELCAWAQGRCVPAD